MAAASTSSVTKVIPPDKVQKFFYFLFGIRNLLNKNRLDNSIVGLELDVDTVLANSV